MRMLGVELKRIIKTRRSMVLIIVGLCISMLMAVIPIMFVGANVHNSDGSVKELNGLSAIRYWREIKAPSDGEVTPQKLKDALKTYKQVESEYGDPNKEEVPINIYLSKISPVEDLLRMLPSTYSDFSNGNLIPRNLSEIKIDEVDSFYEACDKRIDNIIKVDREADSTVQKASSLYNKVHKPFMLYAGYTRDAFDYTCLAILFLVIISVVLCAPLFSENYESGADQIMRCTKYGRGKLARAKLIASILPCVFMYIVAITAHLLISDLSFGTITLKTSVQALYDTASLPNLNLLQLQIVLAIGGLLTLISVITFTQFLSAKFQRVAGTLGVSLLATLAPIFIYAAAGNNWVSAILPAGGVGLNNNLLMQLVDFRFIHLGSLSFWVPQVIMLSTVTWIPICLVLAVHAYCKHQVE